MATWVHTITYPLRKARSFFSSAKNRKTHSECQIKQLDLHGEVMACAYEDVQVMWSMLKESRSCIAQS
ncbi:uncharacterized protein LOC116263351 [Nymphaea colorata]|uniref:uncharacterized protein LOC116263351 n=1 Tax=Nymphaea colorata TaxID=210225 RepID=UPI00129E34B4|nr:uncharacterized protein LOC116263351 [Nymphaea colorata]